MRMGEERLPCRAVEYHPPNRRKRGRPAHTWRKGIEEAAMRKRDLREEDWNDRKLWLVKCGEGEIFVYLYCHIRLQL